MVCNLQLGKCQINMQEAISEILKQREKQHLKRKFVEIEKNIEEKSSVKIGNKSVINFCSNDYLRLSLHHEVCNATIEGVTKYGVGSGGTRNISGTNLPHVALEKAIAKMHGKESALVFASAYVANVGTLFAIGKYLPNIVFFSDEQNHASIIHGIKYSGAKKVIYKHNNFEDLSHLLQKNCDGKILPIIVCEGVYSMSGTLTDLVKLKKIAENFNATIYLDEVHSVGIYGNGKGISAEQGVEIDIINGTLGKAFGTFGGYISGNESIVDFVKSFATTFIFSTSLPPAICSASIKAIEIATSNNLQEKFWKNVKLTKNKLAEYDMKIANVQSHIISILIGSEASVKHIAHKMLEAGFYIQPIFYPTVEIGKAMLRITVSPYHTKNEIENFVKKLDQTMNSLT